MTEQLAAEEKDNDVEWEVAGQRAMQAMKEKDWHTACNHLRRGIELRPSLPRGYVGLSRALASIGDLGGARQAIREGLRRCEDHALLQQQLRQLPHVRLLDERSFRTAVACLENLLTEAGAADQFDLTAVLNQGRVACGLAEQPGFEAFASQLGTDADAQAQVTVLRLLLAAGRTLPDQFPYGLPLLAKGSRDSCELTRWQVFVLLAAGFLGLIPDQGTQGDLPSFNFDTMLQAQPAKSSCLLMYFKQIFGREEELQREVISFRRNVLADDAPEQTPDFWANSSVPLANVKVNRDGAIEGARGALQADFANMYIGGGVFTFGRVQEEIRFSICPELLVSCLFCEVMAPNEAIIIVGAQQFAQYTGYGGSFHCTGPYVDSIALDEHCRRDVHVAAFDAMVCTGDFQYEAGGMLRELVKATAAFAGDAHEEGAQPRRPLATGNWGSGAFSGDPQLKFLLQWMACTMAGRDMLYYPFGDPRMAELETAVARWSGTTVGDVWHQLLHTHATQPRNRDAVEWKYQAPKTVRKQ